MTPQLCLGTAQFGLPYGITNTEGQVPESEVAKLLAKLEETDFRWLDTAHAYGNAEEVIGRNLWEGHSLRIITKLPAQPQVAFTGRDAVVWEQAFQLSCERLGVKSLNALLLHAPSDLSKPGSGYLEDWLLGLKQRGLVDRLGAHAHLRCGRKVPDQSVADLLRRPLLGQFRLHIGPKCVVGEQLRFPRSGATRYRQAVGGVGQVAPCRDGVAFQFPADCRR